MFHRVLIVLGRYIKSSFSLPVVLNEVKNLLLNTSLLEILRSAQNDSEGGNVSREELFCSFVLRSQLN